MRIELKPDQVAIIFDRDGNFVESHLPNQGPEENVCRGTAIAGALMCMRDDEITDLIRGFEAKWRRHVEEADGG